MHDLVLQVYDHASYKIVAWLFDFFFKYWILKGNMRYIVWRPFSKYSHLSLRDVMYELRDVMYEFRDTGKGGNEKWKWENLEIKLEINTQKVISVTQ